MDDTSELPSSVTTLAAQKLKGQGHKKTQERFMAFSLCDEQYAVPLLKVREVIAVTEITPIPYTSNYFKGIINLRGQIISIIDLRLKFNMKNAEITPESAIVILDLDRICFGVIVDSVNAVLALNSDEIGHSPDIESSISTDYITGIVRLNKKLVLILDIERTLNVDDILAIRQNVKKNAV